MRPRKVKGTSLEASAASVAASWMHGSIEKSWWLIKQTIQGWYGDSDGGSQTSYQWYYLFGLNFIFFDLALSFKNNCLIINTRMNFVRGLDCINSTFPGGNWHLASLHFAAIHGDHAGSAITLFTIVSNFYTSRSCNNADLLTDNSFHWLSVYGDIFVVFRALKT